MLNNSEEFVDLILCFIPTDLSFYAREDYHFHLIGEMPFERFISLQYAFQF